MQAPMKGFVMSGLTKPLGLPTKPRAKSSRVSARQWVRKSYSVKASGRKQRATLNSLRATKNAIKHSVNKVAHAVNKKL